MVARSSLTPVAPRDDGPDPSRLPAWAQPPPVETPKGRPLHGIVLRAAVALVAAGVFLLLGHPLPALLIVVVFTTVTGLALAKPEVGHAIDRATVRFQHLVGRGLTVVLLGLIYVVVFVPVSLVLRLVRHDPLALGATPRDPSFWRPVARLPGRPLHHRPFTYEIHPSVDGVGGRRAVGRVRAALGLVMVLLLVDLGAGALIDVVRDDGGDPQQESSAVPVPDVGANAGEAWAPVLFEELMTSYDRSRYHPFRGWSAPDFDGDHVHVTDEVRRSYEATAVAGPPVEVLFFGGSSAMGWYQRDEETIASELVKLAEADGIHLRVRNYGQPAYMNWQEVMLLQEVLSRGDVPDLVVFYDGANELGAQFRAGPSEDPIHLQSRAVQGLLQEQGDLPVEERSPWRRMYDGYAEVSAAHRLVRTVRGGVTRGEPPAAGFEEPWPDQASDPQGKGRAAAGLHGRGVDLVEHLAESYGFRTTFFWQPIVYTKDPVPGEEDVVGSWGTDPEAWTAASDAARSLLGPAVVDLSDSLDGFPEPVMYDYVHTNERGAEVIAGAMYRELRPQLDELLAARS